MIPIMECFFYPGEFFPYMVGDIVCDPYYPEFVAWACVDPSGCTANMPNLDDMYDLASTWSMIDSSEAILYYAESAPEDDGFIACQDWSQKFASEDIGDEWYWCEGGRVYYCAEDYVYEQDEENNDIEGS